METKTGVKRGVEAADLFRIRLVNDPNVSPDGARVAFTVTDLDEKENCYRSAIWLVDRQGGEPRRLTSGKHRDSSPRWSPDPAVGSGQAETIAFSSDRQLDPSPSSAQDRVAKGQIWTIPVAGGEPERLTTFENDVEEFVWSPDGRSIACVTKVRVGEHDTDSDVRVIRTIRYRFDGEGFLDDKYRQIFVVDAVTGETQQLTDGPYEHRHPAWSPTGHEIAFDANREEGWELSPVNDIYAVRVNGKAIRRVTDGTGRWSQPSWSPDGTTIACYGTRRLESDAARSELFVVPAGGGSPQSLTGAIDRNFRDGAIADLASFSGRPPLWDASGESLSAVYSEHGQVHLAGVPVPDGLPGSGRSEMQQITTGRRCVGSIALVPGGGYVYAANTPTMPGELFVYEASGTERQLTHVSDAWLGQVELSEPEPFWIESHGGTRVQGWVMKPVGFEASKKYPLVLEIHGGPFGMYGETMMHEFQLFAARGYVVLYTNPRGSTGYGDEFASQLYRAWGKNDFPDLMAAVDWAIAQGYVDEHRLGVLGGSYGGFMTNWVIAHTKRFKAAVTQRCVSNLYSSFGTDDIMFGHAEHTFGATPWEDPDIYWELSPITYVDQIETPLLIEHQEEDYRCPVEQAEQLYTALKRRGKTVEFVRYPGESHGMSRTGQPKHRIERLRYIMDWFDRWL